MIYQAIDHLNFAQGEMAMFSTFIAWQLMQWGIPYWVAFCATIMVSFVAGVAIEQVLFRPIHHAPALSHIVIFIALFAILNSLAGSIWGYNVKSFHPALETAPEQQRIETVDQRPQPTGTRDPKMKWREPS
jgi:branched-chain amino acid transport system permease protein